MSDQEKQSDTLIIDLADVSLETLLETTPPVLEDVIRRRLLRGTDDERVEISAFGSYIS